MNLRTLPLIAGLLPVFAIHGAYLVAIAAERVPACIPYISGCTSISATGRYPPASFLFKGAMLPEAVLLAIFWILAAKWLNGLQAGNDSPPRKLNHVVVMGVAGAIALVIYVTFLGTRLPIYEFMRRFGIYLFFLMTVLAQIRVTWLALHSSTAAHNPGLRRIARTQLRILVLPFLLGILNVVLKATLDDPDPAENIIEWIVVMLMQAWFVLAYYAWRLTRFNATFRVSVS